MGFFDIFFIIISLVPITSIDFSWSLRQAREKWDQNHLDVGASTFLGKKP